MSRLRAAIGGLCLLAALVVAGPVVARSGISMAYSVSPSSDAGGKTVTWTMVLTPSGTTYTNLGIDWGPYAPGFTVSGCNFGCRVDPRTGHVDWTLATVKARTVVHLYTTTPAGSQGSISATAYISTPVVCLNGCGGTLTVFLSKPAAKVAMLLSPSSARTKVQTTGCGLADCRYVTFTATFSYVSLSDLPCNLNTPVTWDGRMVASGSIALHTYSGTGCIGKITLRQEGWGLAAGPHRVCAGSTDQAGYYGKVGCATFTVTAAATPAPTPTPRTATPAPSAEPSTAASAPASVEPSEESFPAPSAVAIAVSTPVPAPTGSGAPQLVGATSSSTPSLAAVWVAGAIALGVIVGMLAIGLRHFRRGRPL